MNRYEDDDKADLGSFKSIFDAVKALPPSQLQPILVYIEEKLANFEALVVEDIHRFFSHLQMCLEGYPIEKSFGNDPSTITEDEVLDALAFSFSDGKPVVVPIMDYQELPFDARERIELLIQEKRKDLLGEVVYMLEELANY